MHDYGPLPGFFIIAGLIALYFVPAVWAHHRHHRNENAILLTTLFFGWTCIGWVIALIWASSDNVQPLSSISSVQNSLTAPPLNNEDADRMPTGKFR
jgi:hypothetical protein